MSGKTWHEYGCLSHSLPESTWVNKGVGPLAQMKQTMMRKNQERSAGVPPPPNSSECQRIRPVRDISRP